MPVQRLREYLEEKWIRFVLTDRANLTGYPPVRLLM
jgi:hypothetical protein